jgi:hypothetical protein
MTTFILRLTIAITLVSLTFGAALPATPVNAAPDAVGIPTNPIPYAPDYASTTFQDAWDMSQFSDVSQYLNGSGRHVTLANPSVANGMFSATTLGDYTADQGFIYLLFPDYPTMTRTGKLGSLHPIKTS